MMLTSFFPDSGHYIIFLYVGRGGCHTGKEALLMEVKNAYIAVGKVRNAVLHFL